MADAQAGRRRLQRGHAPCPPRAASSVALLVCFAALYLVLAMGNGAHRWDGFAPQPYRYVSPPAGVVNGGKPSSATGTIPFIGGRSNGAQIYTQDLQAQMIIPAGAFPPDAAGDQVIVTVVPQAAPAVPGLVAYGNAYAVTAKYVNGGPVPEPWKAATTLYLRFPPRGVPDGLYEFTPGKATRLSTAVDFPNQTVQGNVTAAGAFVDGTQGKGASAVLAGTPAAGTAAAAGAAGTTVGGAAAGGSGASSTPSPSAAAQPVGSTPLIVGGSIAIILLGAALIAVAQARARRSGP